MNINIKSKTKTSAHSMCVCCVYGRVYEGHPESFGTKFSCVLLFFIEMFLCLHDVKSSLEVLL